MNHAKITLTIGADDALLLQGHARMERLRFKEAGNEVMGGMLERVDEAITNAQAPRKVRPTRGFQTLPRNPRLVLVFSSRCRSDR
jgi:hypothetical protein